MNILKKLIINIAGIFFVFSMFFYVFFGKTFIMNENQYVLFLVNTLIVLSLSYCLYNLLHPTGRLRDKKDSKIRLFFLSIVLIITIPILIKVIFFQSLSFTFHKLFLKKEIEMRTIKYENKYYSIRCRGFTIEEYSYMNNKICGISNKFLSKLNENDELIIKVEKSILGLEVKEIKLEK